MPVIKTKHITKIFPRSKFSWRRSAKAQPDKVAVKDLSLEIEEGEFVGFLGPNGAGKTTFLKILCGIIYPTFGTAKVLGFTPWERKREYLRQIAIVMGQKNQLVWDLPAIDSFRLIKEIYSLDQKTYQRNLEEIVGTLGMEEILNNRLRQMSLGERMKCELAACLLHEPKVIFLDEPTIGLDVVSAQAIRHFLAKVNQEKKSTIILTSHYMADVEALCRRVVIVNQGQEIFDGSLEQLRARHAQEKVIQIYLGDVKAKEKFAHLEIDKRLEGDSGMIRVARESLGQAMEEVLAVFPIEDITITDPETEEIISQVFQS